MECAAEPGKLTISIGHNCFAYDPAFLLSLGVAVFVVFVFSITKFGESTIQKNDNDLITQLLPKYLATPEEYSRALILYVSTMIAIVVVLSFLGPRVLALGSKDIPDAPNAVPLFIALVIVGMLPNVPWLQELERHLRRFAHERAYIPRAARAIAEQLASAEFNFQNYKTSLTTPALRGVDVADFSAPRDSIEYSWARLSCILYQLRRMQDAGLVENLDGEVLDQYAKDFDNLALNRKSMEDDIAEYRRKNLATEYFDDGELHRSIRKALRQLYVLLACAVRLKVGNDSDTNSGLRPFGFMLHPAKIGEGNRNLMIVGLAVMTGTIFVAVYGIIGVERMLSTSSFWQPSDEFPKALSEPFIWAFSSLLGHGTAIFVADRIRNRLLGKQRWYARAASNLKRNPANYVLIAVASGIVGFCVLFMWSVSWFGAPSFKLALVLAPFSLLPAVTGGFYVFHLDSVDLDARPSRVREVGLQALATGFCGFAAASTANTLNESDFVLDLAMFYVALGVVIGSSLAWYIPSAAAANKYDPIAEVLQARIASLKSAAVEKYGEARAQQWIEDPNPALNDRAPQGVVGDIAMYEKAVTLLRAA